MKITKFNKLTSARVIPQALKVLQDGGVIIFPTETCYGLGVDATNNLAVSRIFEYKGKRGNKPMSIAVANQEMAQTYVEVNEIAQSLYSTLLPGAVTVVSKSKGNTAEQLTSDTGTLGVRIPDYPLLLKLIGAFGKPITATSANTSGKKPPYSLTDLKRYTSARKLAMIDLFLDAGTLPERLPSTVVDTTLNEPRVLRQGKIALPKTAHEFASTSVAETLKIGEELMSSILKNETDKPIIIAIQGELGAGKTHLVKGIARTLGIAATVNSPTYTIVREYEIRANTQVRPYKKYLFHLDTWRLHDGQELWDLGLKSMLRPGNVVAIEWLQKIKPILDGLTTKARVVWVDIQQTDDAHRIIRVWSS